MNRSPDKYIRVIHACQWDLYRYGVKTALAKFNDIHMNGEAKNGQDLLDMLEEKQADVVLLDLNMPVMNGLEALPIVKDRFPYISVIMLTMFNDPRIILQTLESGANGYLTAEADSNDIYNAILSSFKPGIYFSKGAKRSLIPSLEHPDEKELQVMQLLAEGLSEGEIAQKLNVSNRSIQSIVGRLFKSASVNTVDELITLARRQKPVPCYWK